MAKKETHTNEGREGVLHDMQQSIEEMFTEFNVPVAVDEAIEGQRNYHFYLTLTKPYRMKQLHGYLDDLRYALSSDKVEIQAPIPDQKRIGITVPKKTVVLDADWRSAIAAFDPSAEPPLTVPFGVDEFGVPHNLSLTKLPHAIIGGTTGAGKTNVIHSCICSLLYQYTPDQLRFIMIDPKRVELTIYDTLPHLMTEVITDSKKALLALKWLVKEMERRYDILQAANQQTIAAYHQHRSKDDEPLPYICVVFDEVADLMHTYPQAFEAGIVRLAQMSRAVGIHMLLATQRPSVNVIPGSVKANIPARIAFQVASQIDSRTILDQTGAEKLAGQGDALLLTGELPRPLRVQTYHIEESDVRKIVAESTDADAAVDTLDLDGRTEPASFFESLTAEEEDDLYQEAKQAVIESGKASTSYLQRKLKLGYSRCARLIDMLEEQGVISPQIGSKPREVLTNSDEEDDPRT
ncbi:MAG TPA: DNA translocase FtsK [Candidatus Paceibacterota bacterium]|nr:DNA translocase FtsK [Candidatus Paceibacterota bacterium]